MPNMTKETAAYNPELSDLVDTIKTLRGEEGCPWDKRQSSSSLLKHLKSECEELILAINNDDHVNICEELGDLLYLIVMISEIHNDQGQFQLSDVIRTVNEKLIRRHPHVFAGQPYENEEQLAAQWQAIKAEEKKKNTV
jgi:tetrapyrrole methylase family protein / MazG family protein